MFGLGSHIASHGWELGARCTSYQTYKHCIYLIAARCVVEHLQGCLIAVRHISSSAEEHQSTRFIRQRTPEYLYTTALLREGGKNERNKEMVRQTICKGCSPHHQLTFSPTANTFIRRLPWMPNGSWLMAMAALFCSIARAPLFRVRRSLDMKRGAAIIAHNAIWERDWSMLRPKFPITSWEYSKLEDFIRFSTISIDAGLWLKTWTLRRGLCRSQL